MRIIRTVIASLLAALLAMSVLAAAPAQADRALPERTITEKDPMDYPVAYNAFKLKGKVTELQADGITYLPYAKQKVQVQKKACTKPSCKWKTVNQIKTTKAGKYATRIFVPRTGKWKWRVKVKGSDGYKTTKGEVWTLLFQ